MSEEAEEIKPDNAETKKAGVKKEHTYTYWVDEKNKSRELPEDHKPKKIDPPPSAAEVPSNGPSKWNALGTWEQRMIPVKELNENVSKAINDWLTDKECQLVLTEVKLEGEFKQIYSNNKKKILYELSGEIKFEGEELMLKIQEVACSGDQEYTVKGKKQEEKEKLIAVGEKIIQVMVDCLNQYKL